MIRQMIRGFALSIAFVATAGCAAPEAATSAAPSAAAPAKAQITVLNDAFGKDPAMAKDWGYAAFIEVGGKRILFDTGNDGDVLKANAKAKGVDLTKLDFVVMSHRHSDHMGGLAWLLSVNPKVKVYAPLEGFGVYGFALPATFPRHDESLDKSERYFDGNREGKWKMGTAWPGADFQTIDKTTQIAPGVHVIALVSDKPGTLELRELSLAIETPDGLVVVVGCSHPGIDSIVKAAAAISPRIHLVTGGMHLLVAKDADLQAIVATLHDTYKVQYVAPGHCTGELTFNALRKAYGDRYLYSGVGTVLALGPQPRAVASAGWSVPATLDTADLGRYRELLATSPDLDTDHDHDHGARFAQAR